MTNNVNSSVANSVVIVKAFDFGKIKQAYKMGKSTFNKMQKLNEKLNEITKEIEAQQELLNGINVYCEKITGGYTPQELLKETTIVTDKEDKNGNPIKVTKLEPSNLVTWNEEKRYYEVTLPVSDEPTEIVDYAAETPTAIVEEPENIEIDTPKEAESAEIGNHNSWDKY